MLNLFLSNTELTDWLFIPKIQKEGTSLLAHCFSSAYYYILTLLTRFVYKQRVLKRIVSVSRKIRLKAIHNRKSKHANNEETPNELLTRFIMDY